ncbi:ACP S-malonyltransferase [Ancylobacter sp.]|uniref:ACP S-malonyltransferase n=1 Tax=Ancylobacter sp. TaxID=1872567 RepID=UPI003D13379E
MRTALLFPGQGAQRPGMLSALPDHPAARSTRAEAADTLGQDWRALESAEALEGTLAAQLALLIAGVATARMLAAEGARVDVVLGQSVGAFPAAVAAGCLAFADALKLVRLRASDMARLYPSGFGMVAIVGLTARRVAALVEAAREGAPLYISNDNAPLQQVISGADEALARACAAALDAGARKAERLHVATPSHCPLLDPVAVSLMEAFRTVEMRAPRIAYASASRARMISDPAALAEDLSRNVAQPVRWRETTELLVERGVRLFLQAPPGSVLTDLVGEAHPELRSVSLETLPLKSVLYLAAHDDEKR